MYSVKDFKRAWIIYKVIKKGESKMEEIKKFVVDHKKELLLASAGIMLYSLGFNKGFKSAEKGMNYIFEQASKSLAEVTKF